jgi:hypothetical protein
MQRDLAEVLDSQRQMLERRGRPAPDGDEAMAGVIDHALHRRRRP